MKILPIGYKTNITNHNNSKPKQTVTTAPVNFTSGSGNYGLALLHIYQMDKLKEETKQFPQDIAYREQLMTNAGLNPQNQHKIRAIIGPQEIKSILKDFDGKPDVFSTGNNWENVNNGRMRANIHMHTTASDGSLTVTELLDNASEYANNVKRNNPNIKEPFVVAITDHDTTEGAKEAIKVISEHPMKYANLRVILGAEITTFNNIGMDMVDVPTNVHVLTYGIDPNEKIFKNFIDGTKEKKLQLQEMMVESANKTYKKHFGKDNFFSVSEAKHQYNTVSKNIIGIYNGMETYFATKTAVEQIILKDKHIVKKLKKHNMPTNTEDFMERLSEYHAGIDGNNKILSPLKTLPEFISITTTIKEDTVQQKLEKGLEKLNGFREELKTNLSQYKVTTKPKYDYMPDFAKLHEGLKGQPKVITGIAHPIDTLKYIQEEDKKYTFLEDLYSNFKQNLKEKAKFTEAYYQSYKPLRKEFNDRVETQQFFEKVKKVFKLFRTGSHDTHGVNIFVR